MGIFLSLPGISSGKSPHPCQLLRFIDEETEDWKVRPHQAMTLPGLEPRILGLSHHGIWCAPRKAPWTSSWAHWPRPFPGHCRFGLESRPPVAGSPIVCDRQDSEIKHSLGTDASACVRPTPPQAPSSRAHPCAGPPPHAVLFSVGSRVWPPAWLRRSG